MVRIKPKGRRLDKKRGLKSSSTRCLERIRKKREVMRVKVKVRKRLKRFKNRGL